MVTSAAVGVPAMAAMSLRHRPSALWPIFSGGASEVKWTPSTTASVLNSSSRSGTPSIQHGAIVARAHDDGGIGRQRARQAVDELELVHAAQVCWMRNSVTKFRALNSAWAVMGASRLSVRS